MDYEYDYPELNLEDWDDEYEEYLFYLDWLEQSWD